MHPKQYKSVKKDLVLKLKKENKKIKTSEPIRSVILNKVQLGKLRAEDFTDKNASKYKS
jgi:hypothetical protein